jgi:hypothetical protein
MKKTVREKERQYAREDREQQPCSEFQAITAFA